VWDEEGRERFRDDLERIEQDERSVQCVVGEMSRRIREAIKKTERERGRKGEGGVEDSEMRNAEERKE